MEAVADLAAALFWEAPQRRLVAARRCRVPAVAGHPWKTPIRRTRFLGMCKSGSYADVSLDQWTGRLPPLIAEPHLRLDSSEIAMIPRDYPGVIILGLDTGFETKFGQENLQIWPLKESEIGKTVRDVALSQL